MRTCLHARIFSLPVSFEEKGFENFNIQDDDESFEDSVLDGNNNDDGNQTVVDAWSGTGPLTASLIRQDLKKATDLKNHFLIHDPNEERSAKLQRAIKCYNNLYKKTKQKMQCLMTDFFKT